MTAVEPPRIVAILAEPGQRDALICAGDQLAYAVGAALGREWPVRLRLIGADDPEIPPGVALVAVPFVAAEDPVSLADAEALWARRIASYRGAGHDRILLANLFQGDAPRAPGGVARIRQLNRLAVELSRRHGAEIVDVDRLLALVGARALAAAPQGADLARAQLTGHAIAHALLQGDLGPGLEPAVQVEAGRLHGDGRNIPRLTARFLTPDAA